MRADPALPARRVFRIYGGGGQKWEKEKDGNDVFVRECLFLPLIYC